MQEVTTNVSATDLASCEDTTTEDESAQIIVEQRLKVVDESDKLSDNVEDNPTPVPTINIRR